jgi:hypothetical protein
MNKAKADSVDTWNEYQAKKLKWHLAEATLAQSENLKPFVPEKALAMIENQEKESQKLIEKYQRESADLSDKAKSLEKQYDDLNFVDDQFDLSDACLSLSLMLLAVTALTAESWLLFASWGISAVGFLFALSGFAGWGLHPDWIIRFLS